MNGQYCFEGHKDGVFHSHRVGERLLLVALDSGHAVPQDGDQAAWLEVGLTTSLSSRYEV